MKDVVLKFGNVAAARHFVTWLCESGEQDYWEWMRYRESEEEGDITAVTFDYHGGTKSAKQFAKHPIIANCGRLDSDEFEDDEEPVVCRSCSQNMAWSPSGHYCGNQKCVQFRDTPESS